MKLSTKSRYGMRLMADLAAAENGKYVSLKEVASRQEISEKYLEQIVISLARAGLVVSSRGARGGYQLARPASEITAAMVLEATEGRLAFLECDFDGGTCPRSGGCATRVLWQKLGQSLRETAEKITLEQLVNGQMD